MPKKILLVFCFTVYYSFSFANNIMKSEMRLGNKAFKSKDYVSAELNYRKALDSLPKAPDVQYNLGCAIYMQMDSVTITEQDTLNKLTSSVDYFQKSAEAFVDKSQKEASYFNLGNTYLKMRNLDKAIDAYKQSLRINPNNYSTKENLYYAQLLKQQQDQQPQNKNNKNQDNKDQNQNQQNDQNQNNKDQNQDKQNDKNEDKKDKNQDQQNGQNKEDQNQQGDQQPQPQNISREDAERILNAMQQQENQTKENLEKQKGKPIRANSGKNW